MAPTGDEATDALAKVEARLVELQQRLLSDLEAKVEEAIARVKTAANAARVGIADAEAEADVRIEQVGAKAIRDLAAARDRAEAELAAAVSERAGDVQLGLLDGLERAEEEARERVVGIAAGLAEAIAAADHAQARERRVRGEAQKVAAGVEELRRIGRSDGQHGTADVAADA